MNRSGTPGVIAGRNVLRFEWRYPLPAEKVWRAITERVKQYADVLR